MVATLSSEIVLSRSTVVSFEGTSGTTSSRLLFWFLGRDRSLLLRDLASLTSKKPGLSARPAKQAFHLGVKLRSKPDPSNVKSYKFQFPYSSSKECSKSSLGKSSSSLLFMQNFLETF